MSKINTKKIIKILRRFDRYLFCEFVIYYVLNYYGNGKRNLLLEKKNRRKKVQGFIFAVFTLDNQKGAGEGERGTE